MVMHARKPQRITDGYFEKHQTHPYQASKYGSSKGNYDGRYNHERMRDSPNGNSYRSDSPDSQSPRDRTYQSKNLYLQKIREKERETRDYKSREKYSDGNRSPKDKRNRDAEHRTNHDRSSTEEKREERDRVVRVGDWSEHISSSGKKYYYNCKTEVSQWEKPREWIERERKTERSYSSSSRTSSHDKHSNSRPSMSNSRESLSKPVSSRQLEKRESYWNNQSSSSREDGETHDRRKHLEDVCAGETQTQDMDISPGDSTPTSETSYNLMTGSVSTQSAEQQGPVLLSAALPRLTSHHIHTSPPAATPVMVPPPTSNAPGPPATSLANLPRLLSQITSNAQPDLCTQKAALQAIQTALMATRQVSMEPLKVDTSNATPIEGPPTPTHSESQDCVDVRKLASPPSSLSSLQTVGSCSSLHALRPPGPHITPSLANHYRDDLVNHVRGWPADALEKQAQKLSEEGHTMGSLQCTRVSADLKTARSTVRLTEIQATLQEQRILFLRQQIETLEHLKSQNSFMSDDS